MKVGQTVGYVDSSNVRHQATVAALYAKGDSGAWRLSLDYRDGGESMTVDDVPYRTDVVRGGHYWLLKGERKLDEDELGAPPTTAQDDPTRPITSAADMVATVESGSAPGEEQHLRTI
jgi:hypothetical protein